ncbi:Hypothetical protein FKW44_021996 [Caligus rogercresseyi]|uniref:Uncharacterized protein n=1 Tax=Caligus rogercresseyi TaxID=217165 RepID=A0A7T8GSA7_CALRO|nr:Hypothetical protein FKW44_021996 [Caligus rogercresseyi]
MSAAIIFSIVQKGFARPCRIDSNPHTPNGVLMGWNALLSDLDCLPLQLPPY